MRLNPCLNLAKLLLYLKVSSIFFAVSNRVRLRAKFQKVFNKLSNLDE